MSAEKPNPCNLERGAAVGPYEIIGRVGEGGFGYIFKVRRGGKAYALKISRQRHGDLPPEDRRLYEERLHREVAALTSLHHPNIVRVHSFDRWPELEDGYPYLVMDLIEGSCLDEWARETRPSLAEICLVFERIAGAVAHMHALSIYHRDLKSSNVLVRTDGEPIIVDFGIARPRTAYNVTRAASVGTVANYAPEYAEYCDSEAFGREPFEWRPTADLHSLGYMLYEVLTDEPPFPVGSESDPLSEAAILDAIKTRVPRPPSQVSAAVPSVLDGIALRLLEKSPARRLQSAGELAEMLRRAREEAGAAWKVPARSPEGKERELGEGEAPPLATSDLHQEGESIPTVSPNAGEGRVIGLRAGPRGGEPVGPPGPQRPPFDVPPVAGRPAFVEEEGMPARETSPAAARGMPSAVREMTAQLKAGAPRRVPGPLLAGGGIIAVAVILVIVAGMRDGPPANGPKALFSAPADPEGVAGGRPLQMGPDAPATEPKHSGGLVPELADRSTAGGGAVPPEHAQGAEGKPGRKAKTRRRAQAAAARVEKAPILTASALPTPSGLLRSHPTEADKAMNVAAGKPKPLGVPLGAHMRAKLLTNLDSRTIGVGPVEAELTVPVVVRGEMVLPARTRAYGTASEGSDRFNVRFTRLRLPDDTEIAFEGLALARDEGKPGLAAGRRIDGAPESHDGLATKIAKGTGNILLDTITGGTAQDIARSAGQATLSHEAPAAGGSGAVLLLDAGVVFDIFVEHAF